MPRLSTEHAERYIVASKRAVDLKSTLGCPPSPIGALNIAGAKASADTLESLTIRARDAGIRKLRDGKLAFESQQKSYLKKQYPPPMGPFAPAIAGVAAPVPKPMIYVQFRYPMIDLSEIHYLKQMSQFALRKVQYLTVLNEACDHWKSWVFDVKYYISHGALSDSRDQIDVVRMETWKGSDQDAKSIVHSDIIESLREVSAVPLYNNKSKAAAAVEHNRQAQTNRAISSFGSLIKAADANQFYEACSEIGKRIEAFTRLAKKAANEAEYLLTLSANLYLGSPLVFLINPNTGVVTKVSQ